MTGKLLITHGDYRLESHTLFPTLPLQGGKNLAAAPESFSGFYGFGVAITPSSCYEMSKMDTADRKKLLTHLYTQEGLGLKIARLCIGSCDYSPEIYSYDDVPFDTDLTHFSIERDMAYVVPMIQEILEVNPDLYLFASPWSPPFWMKTGGSIGGGFMQEQYLDCYADYIIKFLKAYDDLGIHIRAITPQNEPETHQSGKMPACIWHPEHEAKFIGILRQKLREKHMSVGIWMYDHNFSDMERPLWSLQNYPGLSENCNGVAFHYYTGAIEKTRAITEQFPELELHFTEGGPRLNDNYGTDWCKWATIAVNALKTGYRSFTGWNLMLDELGGPHIGPFSGICGGLVTRNSRNGELNYSGQYWAFAHIAPYLTPDCKIHSLTGDTEFHWSVGKYPSHQFPIDGIVIEQTNGKTVAVVVNPNPRTIQSQIQLGGQLWYLELRPGSVSTLIVET